MDFTNSHILLDILNTFRNASVGGAINLIPHAQLLLSLLAIINICTTWTLYEGQLRISQMVNEIMKISFFLFIIFNWVNLNGMIMNSFKIAGFVAAGMDPSTNPVDVMDPSAIMNKGFFIVDTLLDKLSHIGVNFGGAFLLLIATGVVLIAFFIMSFQLMLTMIEFNIFAGIAVILMPFGVIRYTHFLFQRCISAVFAFGVKLMVMFFLLGIVMTIVGQQPQAIQGEEFGKILAQALSYLVIGLLCWKVPNLASTMVQGTPSFDGSDTVRRAATGTASYTYNTARGRTIPGRLGKGAILYGAHKTQQAARWGMSTEAGQRTAVVLSQMAGLPVASPAGSATTSNTRAASGQSMAANVAKTASQSTTGKPS